MFLAIHGERVVGNLYRFFAIYAVMMFKTVHILNIYLYIS